MKHVSLEIIKMQTFAANFRGGNSDKLIFRLDGCHVLLFFPGLGTFSVERDISSFSFLQFRLISSSWNLSLSLAADRIGLLLRFQLSHVKKSKQLQNGTHTQCRGFVLGRTTGNGQNWLVVQKRMNASGEKQLCDGRWDWAVLATLLGSYSVENWLSWGDWKNEITLSQ